MAALTWDFGGWRGLCLLAIRPRGASQTEKGCWGVQYTCGERRGAGARRDTRTCRDPQHLL